MKFLVVILIVLALFAFTSVSNAQYWAYGAPAYAPITTYAPPVAYYGAPTVYGTIVSAPVVTRTVVTGPIMAGTVYGRPVFAGPAAVRVGVPMRYGQPIRNAIRFRNSAWVW